MLSLYLPPFHIFFTCCLVFSDMLASFLYVFFPVFISRFHSYKKPSPAINLSSDCDTHQVCTPMLFLISFLLLKNLTIILEDILSTGIFRLVYNYHFYEHQSAVCKVNRLVLEKLLCLVCACLLSWFKDLCPSLHMLLQT